jgi:hypothetical protein
MRIQLALLAAALCSLVSGDETRLSPRFQTVYIMEMANAFDQHLASRLTNAHVLWVVLDPKHADAVMTESLDDSFLSWMHTTYPPAAGSAAASDASSAAIRKNAQVGEHRRGTVFLVDPRNKLVLWSYYESPRNSSPEEADRIATRIAADLKIAFGRK